MNKLFPTKIDNNYTGARIALYVFPIIVFMTVLRSLIHMLAADGGAQSIAGITLNKFDEGAAMSIVAIFAVWGISQLLFGVFYLIVFVKYKSLIPLMYGFLLLEYLLRLLLGLFKSIETTHTPPGVIGNYVLVPVFTLLLLLSLKKVKD